MAVAFPQGPVITHEEVRDDFGQYGLSYSGNGLSVAQRGFLKPLETENGLENVFVQEGSYAYYGPDHKLYKVSYIADENGFQPTADFFPIAPEPLPVPAVELPIAPAALF